MAATRVLVIDDNTDGAQSLAMVLEICGHDVRVAHDGQAGLAAAAEFIPEVVVLDIAMPGMNGYEVARSLRANPRLQGAYLIALTGFGKPSDEARSNAAGFDEHLTKPVEPERLLSLIAGRATASSKERVA
jgi:CheY-like chemotaxis protein